MKRFSEVMAARAGALLGFLGVALGAFGAHALRGTLLSRGSTAMWEKAVLYHLVHAVVLVAVANLRPFPRWAWVFLAVGIVGFSGSLYVYALAGIRWLVFVTPFGGLFLLAGWLLLALRRPPAAAPDLDSP